MEANWGSVFLFCSLCLIWLYSLGISHLHRNSQWMTHTKISWNLCIYYIWRERNSRLKKGQVISFTSICFIVSDELHFKLSSMTSDAASRLIGMTWLGFSEMMMILSIGGVWQWGMWCNLIMSGSYCKSWLLLLPLKEVSKAVLWISSHFESLVWLCCCCLLFEAAAEMDEI